MFNSKAHPEKQIEAFQTTNGDQYDDYDDDYNYDDQGDPYANQGCDNDNSNNGGGSSGNGGDNTDSIGDYDTLDGANADADESIGRRKRSATGITR